jgi:16S rRNA processing protein RimM
MGVVGRPHGVRGLVHVHSYTADPADLSAYGELENEHGRCFRLRWKSEGAVKNGGVAEIFEIIEGKRVAVATREAAQALVNTRLFVPRAKLPKPDEDEFYLVDLIGMEAVDVDGKELGRVDTVHDYGAGASLEIGRIIVPFTRACVPVVDLAARRITVVIPDEIIVEPSKQDADPAEVSS